MLQLAAYTACKVDYTPNKHKNNYKKGGGNVNLKCWSLTIINTYKQN